MAQFFGNAVEVLKDHPVVTSIVVALVASAILNRVLAKMAERRYPPIGRFIVVDGVRLHYVERGTGRPLVLLHGNGSMIQDFDSSGLLVQPQRPIALLPSTAPDSVTAIGLAAPSGLQKHRLTLFTLLLVS
jgi:hypothetical protein